MVLSTQNVEIWGSSGLPAAGQILNTINNTTVSPKSFLPLIAPFILLYFFGTISILILETGSAAKIMSFKLHVYSDDKQLR